MSAAVEECFVRGDVKHALMIEIDHPEGMAYLWSGIGVLEYSGNSYYGFGLLGSISEVVSSTELEIIETSFNLTGVQDDFLAGLDDSVKGRPARVYEVFLDDHYRVIERDLLLESELDYQVHNVAADGKSSISLKAHAGLFFLRRRSAAKCSPEEARALDADETGFDRIHLQEDISAVWRAA